MNKPTLANAPSTVKKAVITATIAAVLVSGVFYSKNVLADSCKDCKCPTKKIHHTYKKPVEKNKLTEEKKKTATEEKKETPVEITKVEQPKPAANSGKAQANEVTAGFKTEDRVAVGNRVTFRITEATTTLKHMFSKHLGIFFGISQETVTGRGVGIVDPDPVKAKNTRGTVGMTVNSGNWSVSPFVTIDGINVDSRNLTPVSGNLGQPTAEDRSSSNKTVMPGAGIAYKTEKTSASVKITHTSVEARGQKKIGTTEARLESNQNKTGYQVPSGSPATDVNRFMRIDSTFSLMAPLKHGSNTKFGPRIGSGKATFGDGRVYSQYGNLAAVASRKIGGDAWLEGFVGRGTEKKSDGSKDNFANEGIRLLVEKQNLKLSIGVGKNGADSKKGVSGSFTF